MNRLRQIGKLLTVLLFFLAPVSGLAQITAPLAGSSGVTVTSLGQGPLLTGYGQITTTTATQPAALANFGFVQNEILATEAGVAASAPTTAARVFVDYSTVNRTDSGVAVVNPSSSAITVNVQLNDARGNVATCPSQTVAANGYSAMFASQLCPNITDPFLGTLTLTSATAFAATNLQMGNNWHGEALYNSLPVATPNAPPAGNRLYFSQFADGGGFSTEVLLMNLTNAPISGTVSFFDGNGHPVTMNFGPSIGSASALNYSIASNGIGKYITTGSVPGTPIQTGFVVVTSVSGALPSGAVVFSCYNGTGGLASVAGVLNSPLTTSSRMYVEKSNSPLTRNTGVAIVNPNGSTATVRLNLVSLDGSFTASNMITLPANNYMAAFIDQSALMGASAASIPASFQGGLTLSSNVPIAPVTLRMTTNQRGEDLYSTLPVVDLNNPPTGPLYPPQIADGGGYTTQIILINTGSSSGTLTINFFNGGGSAVQIPFTGTFAITSLSTTSPTPLTPLQIGTSGLNTSTPLQIQFSNSAGFSVTEQAISIASDGTVVVGVPLYVDPNTHQISGADVSIVLMQGSRSTAPITIGIQNLPPLSAYGTNLGEISDALLIFNAILLGQRINQIQAFQALPGSTLDTSQAQSTLKALLNAVLQARSDVNRVSLDNALVITEGTLPDGTPIQFDRASLDLMDRVIALFLNQTFATLPAGSSCASRATPSANPDSALRVSPTFESTPWTPTAALQLQTSSLNNLLAALKKLSGANKLASIALQNPQGWPDVIQAMASALGSCLDQLPKSSTNQMLGILAAIGSNINTMANVFADEAALIQAKLTGNQALTDVVLQDMAARQPEIKSALVDFVLAWPFEGAAAVAATVLDVVKTTVELNAGLQNADGVNQNIATSLANENETLPLATIASTAAVSAEPGMTTSQSGIDICCFGTSSLGMASITDPAGNFEIFVPLHVPNTDYSQLRLSVVDPLSSVNFGSEVVDLTGLNTDNPENADVSGWWGIDGNLFPPVTVHVTQQFLGLGTMVYDETESMIALSGLFLNVTQSPDGSIAYSDEFNLIKGSLYTTINGKVIGNFISFSQTSTSTDSILNAQSTTSATCFGTITTNDPPISKTINYTYTGTYYYHSVTASGKTITTKTATFSNTAHADVLNQILSRGPVPFLAPR